MAFAKGHIGYTPKLSEKHRENISKALKGRAGLSGKNNPHYKGNKPPCSVCGSELTKHYSWLSKEQLEKKKCSLCYRKWQQKKENNPNYKGEKPKCKDCNKTLSVWKTVNNVCITCFGKSRRNKHSPLWKGDNIKKSSKLSRERKSPELRLWKKLILERDGLICAICNFEGIRKEMHVDHIKSFAQYPELRTDINNGRVLCKYCHQKTESYGVKLANPKKIG
jgi:hypothetical protein